MPRAPQSKIAESPLFKELRESVSSETTAFTFACGGTIPIVTSLLEPQVAAAESEEMQSTPSACLPVDLRWDPDDPSVEARQTKITFPLELGTRSNLEQLIKDMAPATFGLGGEDVYDESYRKASKMDPTRFASTLNPYDLGIVDAVAQALLPSLRHAKQPRAVKAELYKLNMYSGPSGKFKSHVDTPRSPSQFGSLVICLPLQFKGGALEVRHKGKTVAFDWSSANDGSNGGTPSICWAAFYSDCEHEIFEVTEGHRLTLTYNLYSVRGNGQLGGNYPWLDPMQLPLYKTIRDLVGDEDGWQNGGLIGYNCSHVYPHSNTSKLNFMVPDNLKGADMLMYEIFKSLGLKVRFRPVVSKLGFRDYQDGDALPIVGLSLKGETWDMVDEYYEQAFDEWAGRTEGPKTDPRYVDFLDVHWLNDWGHQEPQITYIAYGNQASNFVSYSCVSMIVEVPPSGAQEEVQLE
ncbi:hypothetical protein C8A00DRAFT_43291 [Chaetomidium leptoderma]|uniref:Fe2OG dioxygenase domain-containing protein n=1 Tax=Chaetomidium leptoderma TaxID=669021 RepID=A0AAN6VLL6_9PEZI|nr:hypothetical protein C8A00DRAFT_43291 [Chaetomidium leptoderma]